MNVKEVSFIDSITFSFTTVISIVYQMYSGLIGMITGTVSAELSGPV